MSKKLKENLQAFAIIIIAIALFYFFIYEPDTQAIKHFKTGRSKYYSDDYIGAIIELDTSILLDSIYEKAFKYRGLAKYKLKKTEEAIEDYNIAIDLNLRGEQKPYSNSVRGEIYYSRGLAFDELSNYKNALQDYDSSLILDPGNADVYFNRGLLKMYSFDDDEGALNDFSTGLKIEINHMIYFHIGVIFFHREDFKESIEFFDRSTWIYPDKALVYSYRAMAYDGMGEYKLAISNINEAMNINPEKYYDLFNLDFRARCKLNLGDTIGACEDWTKAAEMGSPFVKDEINDICNIELQ